MAGDRRAIENPGLASLHTLFLREHNRIAGEINHFEPSWDDEKIFQEARRIVVAELQNIVYNEYLPLVLGDQTVGHHVDSYYDYTVDPTIDNVFATAAYRLYLKILLTKIVVISDNLYLNFICEAK